MLHLSPDYGILTLDKNVLLSGFHSHFFNYEEK